MKIYFGDAGADLFADGVFICNNNQFYYGVEHGTNPGGVDEVTIFDGCGRILPVHLEAIPELIAALQEVQKTGEAVRKAAELTERAESDVQGYVNKIWRNEYEVDFDTAE